MLEGLKVILWKDELANIDLTTDLLQATLVGERVKITDSTPREGMYQD